MTFFLHYTVLCPYGKVPPRPCVNGPYSMDEALRKKLEMNSQPLIEKVYIELKKEQGNGQ